MKALVAMPGGSLDDVLNPERLMPFMTAARTLSHISRWGGRGTKFYSVLQHCVLLAGELPPELKVQGLLHDFSEAWIGDIPAPLKETPEMAFLLRAEEALQRRIWKTWGGFATLDPLVDEFDRRIALDEAIALDLAGEWMDRCRLRPLGVIIRPLSPEEAMQAFMPVAEELLPGLAHFGAASPR